MFYVCYSVFMMPFRFMLIIIIIYLYYVLILKKFNMKNENAS
jgi:hypothetical protein